MLSWGARYEFFSAVATREKGDGAKTFRHLVQPAIRSSAGAHIRIAQVLGNHTLGIEVRTIEGNRRAHDLRELLRLLVIKRQNNCFKFLVKPGRFHIGIILALTVV